MRRPTGSYLSSRFLERGIIFQMHESFKILSAILTVERGIKNLPIFLERGITLVANPFQNEVHIWRPGRHTPTQNLLEYPPVGS